MKQELQSINLNLIPDYVSRVTKTLENGGFEAYLVGGCVRDLILGKVPKDWDVTTNATPEQIISLFEKTVYENKFGTVAVVFENKNELDASRQSPEANNIVEVTPYRIEGKYSDNRHPDTVQFSTNIEDDLRRRDFTVNAMALNSKGHLIDMYGGQNDIKDKILKTVGDPQCRFEEDALRMLRAIRFSVQLGFVVSHETFHAINTNTHLLKTISAERIRDEFVKIVNSPNPMTGIGLLEKSGLLQYMIPELQEGIGCEQGGAHIYDVFTHLVQACQHAADKGYPFHVKLAALFHDIGKPRTRRPGQKKEYTFYGHEVVGARMVQKIMDRLKFSKVDTDLVVKLVRYHMFFSDTEQITLSAVRRMIANVGVENIWTLMQVRECDRVGMKKKEAPYRLRKYHAMIEECLRDPISVKQLKVNGNYLMQDMNMKPGPRMGWILNALLEEVLENPEKNTIETLSARVIELETLPDKELRALGEKAKTTKEQLDEEEIIKLHAKHGIRK